MRGKLLVAQSGGPTPVINCSLLGVLEEATVQSSVSAVLGARDGVLGMLEGYFLDLHKLGVREKALLRTTPGAALGSCRHRLTEEETHRVIDVCRQHDVRFVIYIGGNDSADTAHRLHQVAAQDRYDLRVISVPKTIDNDLPVTDHCPGYGSVARFLALAIMGAGKDTEAMRRSDPVKIIEVMGRNAGWLAASCALGKTSDEDSPHLIYVPELPFSEERFLRDVERVYGRLGYCVAVVSEHVKDECGKPLGSAEPSHVDAFGHQYHDSPARYLAALVQSRLRLRARYDRPGSVQRMISSLVSSVDASEAYLVGRAAVRSAMEDYSDKMVTLLRVGEHPYACTTGLVALEEIANREKLLPQAYIAEANDCVTDAFREYALPLIGDPLPQYVRLST